VRLDVSQELVFGSGVKTCAWQPSKARGLEEAAAASCLSGVGAAVVVWRGCIFDEVEDGHEGDKEGYYGEREFVAANEVCSEVKVSKSLYDLDFSSSTSARRDVVALSS
jgi:hypothetical protein